jgi:hypothetical protein
MSMAVLEWPGRSNEVETQLGCRTSRCTTLRWTRIIALRCHSTTSSSPGDGVAPCCLAASWASTGHGQRAKLLSGEEDDAGKQQLASSRSNQALARPRTTASATATAVPHRVVTGPEPFFFTHVSCGKHRSDHGGSYRTMVTSTCRMAIAIARWQRRAVCRFEFELKYQRYISSSLHHRSLPAHPFYVPKP